MHGSVGSGAQHRATSCNAPDPISLPPVVPLPPKPPLLVPITYLVHVLPVHVEADAVPVGGVQRLLTA
jgi:hypothetical protein